MISPIQKGTLIFFHSIILGASIVLLSVEQTSPALLQNTQWLLFILLLCVGWLVYKTVRNKGQTHLPAPTQPNRFSNEHITQTFISSIPHLTREINLELATTTQIESFEIRDEKSVFWGFLPLGTNMCRVQAKVTYRFHLRLRESWQLSVDANKVHVRAPLIQPSLPPAIHTDTLQVDTMRGWGRFPPTAMAEQLQRELTQRLCATASAPDRLNLVREICRESVAEFVQSWLEGEGRWRPGAFTSVLVSFADESQLPGHRRERISDG